MISLYSRLAAFTRRYDVVIDSHIPVAETSSGSVLTIKVVLSRDGQHGTFGIDLADILCRYNAVPCSGITAGTLGASDNWCQMRESDVERMLEQEECASRVASMSRAASDLMVNMPSGSDRHLSRLADATAIVAHSLFAEIKKLRDRVDALTEPIKPDTAAWPANKPYVNAARPDTLPVAVKARYLPNGVWIIEIVKKDGPGSVVYSFDARDGGIPQAMACQLCPLIHKELGIVIGVDDLAMAIQVAMGSAKTPDVDPLRLVMEERARQDKKWGVQNHDDLYWLGILMEEVGEASKNIIESKPAEETDKELVHVTAVALAWLECRARTRNSGRPV